MHLNQSLWQGVYNSFAEAGGDTDAFDSDILHFHSSLDDVNRDVDIIHIGSTLQYIEDWKGLLTSLNEKYNPKYFVFSDLLAGDVPTFVSHQIFYDKKIAINIYDLKDFKGVINYLSFILIYDSYFQTRILEQDNLPNSALPDGYRLKHSRNMIFKNNEIK